jgi:hypothetical protein
VDTVEWGTGDRPARRLPALRLAVPRIGGLALAVAGFGLLVAAEIVPWASVQSASANTAQTAILGGNQLEVGLDRITAGSGYTYHFGVIVLLGAIGLVLASPPARRRILAGLALGVAAAQVLMVVAVTRTAMRTFDTLTVLSPSRTGTGFQTNLGLQADSGYRVVLGEGVYLASAAILLFVAAAVTTGLLRRGAAEPEPEPAAVVAAPAIFRRRRRAPEPAVAEEDRELTVTPLEPLDGSYFARE